MMEKNEQKNRGVRGKYLKKNIGCDCVKDM